MDHAESSAEAAIEAVFPGAVMLYLPEQSHGEWDFDLKYPDGTMAAVEVTSAISESMARTISAIHGKKHGGSSISVRFCRRSWTVFPFESTSINALRNGADRRLAELEDLGVEEIDYLRAESSAICNCIDSHRDTSGRCTGRKCSAIRDVCEELQIRHGKAFDWFPPAIHIVAPIMGGAIGATTAVEAGERLAWQDDNRTKLGKAKSRERHLVVSLDGSGGPWLALTSFLPPQVPPNIPDEITKLWLIGYDERTREFVVWHAGVGEVWQRMRVARYPAHDVG